MVVRNEVPPLEDLKARKADRGRKIHRDEDPYRPYAGMPDTLRNRLLMFVAKWSPESLAFEAGERKNAPKPREILDDRSLVKWEISDPENPQGREVLRTARELVKIANRGEVPAALDPFAGGGAIPLEAGRLGCQAIANDYNPVAYLILKATCEFPQKYGKPGKRNVLVEEFGKTLEREVRIPNVLVHDFERWANWILEGARQKIGHLYPAGKDGRTVVDYLWARTAPCSNPSCRGEIPLLRSLLVCNREDKKVALTMEVDKQQKTVRFAIAKGKAIKCADGTMQKGGQGIRPDARGRQARCRSRRKKPGSGPRLAALAQGQWCSGLRLGEALNLTWDSLDHLRVDFSGKFPALIIPAELEKGHKDRVLPVTPDFAELLSEVPADRRTGFVFNPVDGLGNRASLNICKRMVATFGEKAGVIVGKPSAKSGKAHKYASAHDLRRAFGTRWAKRLMPQQLKTLMRHECISTTLAFYVTRQADDIAEMLWQGDESGELLNKRLNTAPEAAP